jgi:hypothetical protein
MTLKYPPKTMLTLSKARNETNVRICEIKKVIDIKDG